MKAMNTVNETISTNALVDEAIVAIIQEAVKHFNVIKNRVWDPEEDARYFWNDNELNEFLKQIKYPDRVWVSTVTDDVTGEFYAYRVGRVISLKKGMKRI